MKRYLFILPLLILTTLLFANENISNTQISMDKLDFLFNKNISSDEKKQLQEGQLLIRNIGNAKKICLSETTITSRDVINTMKELKPAYLAEVIQIRPYKGNETLLEELRPILLDIKGYVGIPYWSVRNNKFYDLYSSAQINSSSIEATHSEITTTLEMDPFGFIDMKISETNNENELFFVMTNTSQIQYYDLNIIKPDKMKSLVYVFREGDYIILYGIGGVNAPSIFFLRDRIETSFINRIKSFCQFMFEKI